MTPIHVFRVFIVSMSITLCLFRNDIYFHVPQITYKKKKKKNFHVPQIISHVC